MTSRFDIVRVYYDVLESYNVHTFPENETGIPLLFSISESLERKLEKGGQRMLQTN